MKKTILSLAALFAVSIASAQSYPKQPDRTIVEYREYTKPAEEAKQETDAVEVKQAAPAAKEENKVQKANTPAVLNSNKKGLAVATTEE